MTYSLYSGIIKKSDCKKVNVNSLLALCEIENYDIFCQELESLIASKKNKDLIRKMYCIMQGKFVLGNKKYKDFVNKYQDVIEIMKKYNCLGDMTFLKYDSFGNAVKSASDDYFYKYISEHKEDIETIKKLAIKIRSLGINEITYGENLEFTDIEYQLDTLYGSIVKYLENIEIIPTYNNCPIKYKSNDSCYCITVKTIGYGDKKAISHYGNGIELNSLIFDPERLPSEITVQSTVGTITRLVDESKNDFQSLRNAVAMSVYVDDLMAQYGRIEKLIKSIESIKDKEELKLILQDLSMKLTELKSEGVAFENEVVINSPRIDENRIAEEKQLYLKRRDLSSIDID